MLRWRLLGIDFCIQPSFWLMNAIFAYILAGPAAGQQRGGGQFLLVFIITWILCVLVTVLVHELGHVVTGRIFGQPGNITITGLGGQAVGGYGELRPWQRILVIAAGPGAGFAFGALVIAFDGAPWNMFMDYLHGVTRSEFWLSLQVKTFWAHHTALAQWSRDHYFPYLLAISLLTFISLFVNVTNLLPIIPMDGGMIFKEGCTLIAPRTGLKFAFIWSFGLAVCVTFYMILATLKRFELLSDRFPVHYPFAFPEFTMIVFGMMAYQCLQAYRQLAAMERHSEYAQEQW